MAGGQDARVGVALETVYGTRVAPAKWLPLTAEDLGYTFNRRRSPAIGRGRWYGASVITTQVGSGSISGDVTSTGFGYLLQGLHGNTVTPVQQAATPAYLQTHTLDTAPNKSFSFQVQTPPVDSNVLKPHDMSGAMFGGITFAWSPADVLTYTVPVVYQKLDLTQSNATYVEPPAADPFSFKGGKIEIGGTLEGNIVGDGSIEIGMALRDDAFALGTGGLIAKPTETDKPTATGSFTADYVSSDVNLDRVISNTVADVKMTFTGATISGAHAYEITCLLQDCTFNTQRPTVSGPGPIQLTVAFEASSATSDPPIITYKSTDVLL